MIDEFRSSGPGRHITISYAGFNRPWAAWIAHQLARIGHRASLLRWDPGAEAPLAEALSDLLKAPGKLLLVLDDWYFRLGPRTNEEWNAALREIVHLHRDRFAAVSVANAALPTAVAALVPADLRNLDQVEAHRLLLQCLELPPTALPAPREGAPRFPLDPPEVYHIPRRTQSFTGRDAILEDLFEELTVSGPTGTRLALHGPAGVGKTAIAMEYAHRFGNHYELVHWVDARRRATARDGLAELAAMLRLSAGHEVGGQIRATHEALRRGVPYRPWLLVFDGADSPESVADLLPEGPGHVLVTTLDRPWAAMSGFPEIAVKPFNRDESVAYARRRAPRLTPAEADLLAEAVQDLPLMLAQTASWLHTNTMPVAVYVAQITGGQLDQVGFGIDEDYPRGFKTAWSITLNTLREQYPAAAELLNLMAQFAPDRIPVRLVERAPRGSLPEHMARLAADPIAWHGALARISDATVVRLDYRSTGNPADATVSSVRMHRLYHSFLRTELSIEERRAMTATACQVLVGADPRRPGDASEWPTYAELFPQLEPAGAFDSDDPAVRELVLNCIEYLKLRGEYTTGRELAETVYARWRDQLPAEDRDLLKVQYQQANLERRSGRYHQAALIGRRLVAELADRPPGDTDLLLAQNGLGGTLMALAELEEAHDLYESVWQQYSAVLGPEDPATLQARGNFGLALGLLGRYQEALAMHGEVLAVRERLLRRGHHQTLEAGLQYARLLRLLGRYPEAQSRQELNARQHRQILGPGNPATLAAEHNLAQCLRRSGDLASGAQLMRSVVTSSVQLHGPGSPDTLLVQADWATFLRQSGELTAAAELSQTVTNLYHELVGPAHPYTIGTRGNLALLHQLYGERQTALRIAAEAWEAMASAVGADHPWTLGCELNLSAARQLSGDDEGALELSRDTLARASAVLGLEHPLTFSCQAALAMDLRLVREAEEAARVESDVLSRLSRFLGPEHPHTVAVRRRDRPYWDFEPQPI
ncbi:FxSxx-COOH system tetratricopeptide repeat protein [Streptacidiphilus sp. P02-A3a]|uniref:FxSxx-COOH system tetratricopeptide repeat protein n=1 Tax=Streptacidiphilus sp. P02-A3a TaxID=2704468 RepID=UPI001CDD88CE|nr:FxSxx-COOH system tetratricopeptide repeat protein [Streptacidiphilus sp. P02-A3a]QMU71781.1 tetratricopeptide repeat protein [Streptacidiphilus sp. P02-A3a]